MATISYPPGQRPRVKFKADIWARFEGEVVRENSRTAYIKIPHIVGVLPFLHAEIIRIEEAS